jgi:hypothetical protein
MKTQPFIPIAVFSGVLLVGMVLQTWTKLVEREAIVQRQQLEQQAIASNAQIQITQIENQKRIADAEAANAIGNVQKTRLAKFNLTPTTSPDEVLDVLPAYDLDNTIAPVDLFDEQERYIGRVLKGEFVSFNPGGTP